MGIRTWVVGGLQLLVIVWAGVWLYHNRAEGLAFVGRHPKEVTAALLLSAGGGCLLAAARFGARRLWFICRAGRAIGDVIDVQIRQSQASEDGPDLNWYIPTVRFRAAGRVVELVAEDAATTSATAWRIGTRIRVLYPLANPDQGLIDDWTKWRPMFVPLVVGGIITPCGFIALVKPA